MRVKIMDDLSLRQSPSYAREGCDMIISESIIQLSSERQAMEQHRKQESLTVWDGREEPRVSRGRGHHGRELNPGQHLGRLRQDRVSLSTEGFMQRRQVQAAQLEVPEEQKLETELNMTLLRQLFERLTGRKFNIIEPIQATGQQVPVENIQESAEVPVAQESAGYGLVYDYHESHYEYEKTDFQAGGMIKTADGREIDFSVSLSMSREFYSEENIQIRAGDALKDPLVINFSGTAAQVSQRDFSFDIDADGHADQIGFVDPGSGFLALDKNGDGTVNDGSELFGALSGDGFADLRAYDSDGNNWIDEADAIYQSLRIWSRDSEGNQQLLALGEVGIGALYLGHVETEFSLNDGANEQLGQVRETGIALKESGEAVTMQQLDLVA